MHEANFYDKRYQPSLVQREMVDGGLFGRKSARVLSLRSAEGGGVPAPAVATPAQPAGAHEVTVHGAADRRHALEAAATQLAAQGLRVQRHDPRQRSTGRASTARLALTDGCTAAGGRSRTGRRGRVRPPAAGRGATALAALGTVPARFAFAVAPQAGEAWRARVLAVAGGARLRR
ncbi:MAG: hypothetical protein U1F25_05280 [Rubrivivax sp.]